LFKRDVGQFKRKFQGEGVVVYQQL